MLRVEPGRDASEFLKAAQQQARAREQGYRKRHLRTHQHEL